MPRTHAPTEPTIERRVFEAWSIQVPAVFAETFVHEDDYWHGYDEHRSVSLTSVLLSERGQPASAERILDQLGPLDGSPIDQLPPGLLGYAATSEATQPARAGRVLQGLLATYGRVLVVSITSDDPDWALRAWLSIRSHPAPLWEDTRQWVRGAEQRRPH
jgi:hypothetical protein